MTTGNNRTVSFDHEPLILVDSQDNVLGYKPKAMCHEGPGRLHRAFSVFVFNRRHELLIQQRSQQKPLWPLYWSNSCCSHPRRGETLEESVCRRLGEELSINPQPEFLFRFIYQARYGDIGAEHELCSVYLAFSDDPVEPNPAEVNSVRWTAADVLDRELEENPSQYTPWFRLEWPRVRDELTLRQRKRDDSDLYS